MIFRVRGERHRIDIASKLLLGVCTRANMRSDFDLTLNAMRACLRIRNLFAHCHWAQSKKRGLFFINLEENAIRPEQFNPNEFRHVSARTLSQLEDYFFYTIELLEYLSKELAFRAGLCLPHGFSKPKKRREPNPDTILFPHKPLR